MEPKEQKELGHRLITEMMDNVDIDNLTDKDLIEFKKYTEDINNKLTRRLTRAFGQLLINEKILSPQTIHYDNENSNGYDICVQQATCANGEHKGEMTNGVIVEVKTTFAEDERNGKKFFKSNQINSIKKDFDGLIDEKSSSQISNVIDEKGQRIQDFNKYIKFFVIIEIDGEDKKEIMKEFCDKYYKYQSIKILDDIKDYDVNSINVYIYHM